MCFSATASFVAAGFTGMVGVITMTRATRKSEFPVAAMPCVFAVQQAIEGALWLTLPHGGDGAAATMLPLAFLLFAEPFWPVFAPIAALLLETDRKRRQMMLGCAAVGICVSAYLLWSILTRTHGAMIQDGHIMYLTDHRSSEWIGLAYLAATGLPFLLSSRRAVSALGAILLVGSFTAYVFYWEFYVSVWCFFAAVGSVVLLAHFEHARRGRQRLAGA
ncbi:DUF6629 family protein [Emcibacter sp. SYSU 3D8]|uniref:DUF6629 family protein n=1 Tax=Emcibacter sp. SYSU 3D8 TaxID=3133969 RepID=UPI0031FEB6A3